MIAPYIDRWPEALAIMAQPSNVPMSLNHLAKIVDEIWYLAGDKSADVSETKPSISYAFNGERC